MLRRYRSIASRSISHRKQRMTARLDADISQVEMSENSRALLLMEIKSRSGIIVCMTSWRTIVFHEIGMEVA